MLRAGRERRRLGNSEWSMISKDLRVEEAEDIELWGTKFLWDKGIYYIVEISQEKNITVIISNK